MASLSTTNNVASERRTSTFLQDAKVDASDKNEWASMASNSTLDFNDSLPSSIELENIQTLRSLLGVLLTEGPLSLQPENTSDFKLLRFLRGYENSVEEAEAAYREMAKYREENGFNQLRQKLIERGKKDPNYWEEYKPVMDIISKGVRYEYGRDKANNVVTVTDIGALDIRAIIKHNLANLWSEMALMTEEYSNLKLHDLTVERGRLVARHDIINVSNFGVFQWNKACYDLITKVFAGNKHYPECVVKITSCGNGSVAVIAWKVMKHFVPERTKKKLSVLGTTFVPSLVQEVPFNSIPLAWGGGGSDSQNGFDAAWSEACENRSVNVGRRDTQTFTIGVERPNQIIEYSWKLTGYSIKVSTQFASLAESPSCTTEEEKDKEKEKGERKESETNEAISEKTVILLDSLPLISCGDDEKTVESTAGVQHGRFVAPCRGAFVLKFDNTFSMFRSKMIENLTIRVLDTSNGAAEEAKDEDDNFDENDTEGMTF